MEKSPQKIRLLRSFLEAFPIRHSPANQAPAIEDTGPMPADTTNHAAPEPDLDREAFAPLFSRNARRIYGFIMTLVFNHQDAEEVFQNTSIVLWNKFAEFRPDSNFFAWA